MMPGLGSGKVLKIKLREMTLDGTLGGGGGGGSGIGPGASSFSVDATAEVGSPERRRHKLPAVYHLAWKALERSADW